MPDALTNVSLLQLTTLSLCVSLLAPHCAYLRLSISVVVPAYVSKCAISGGLCLLTLKVALTASPLLKP